MWREKGTVSTVWQVSWEDENDSGSSDGSGARQREQFRSFHLSAAGSFRAARMRASSSGASRGPAKHLTFILGPPQAGTDTFLHHRALKLGEHSHHLGGLTLLKKARANL